MSELNKALYEAYVGEAKAALRLKVYADKADTPRSPNCFV